MRQRRKRNMFEMKTSQNNMAEHLETVHCFVYLQYKFYYHLIHYHQKHNLLMYHSLRNQKEIRQSYICYYLIRAYICIDQTPLHLEDLN